MQVVTTISEIRGLVAAARVAGKSIGFVPTMGALHKGHASLIERSASECGFTVVSIFVNPAQFGPGEDFERYPRNLEGDATICRQAGADVIFAPEVNEVYPRENLTWVNVEKLTDSLCGRSRPGHFRGVTTVCTKLFNIVASDAAYFGQKDAQQAVVIRRMAEDLLVPLRIVVCPTVREDDGLAASSRNRYLPPPQRKAAALLYQSLLVCREMIAGGEKDADHIRAGMLEKLAESPLVRVEYACLVDAETLEPLAKRISGRVMAAVAAVVGSARLIDNIVLDAAD